MNGLNWAKMSTPNDDSEQNSSIEKNNADTMLVGKSDKGFWRMNTSTGTWTEDGDDSFTIGSGAESSITKINVDTMLVGSNDKGFWKAHL